MSKWEEIHKIVDDIEKELNEKIKPIQIEYQCKKDKAIHDFLGYQIGEILKYNCRGSGYIGKYNGVNNDNIVLNLCNKSGVDKNKKFTCCFLEFERIEKI